MATFKDYYQVLEVDAFAEADVVKASFRRLARKYHPDLNADNPAAEERFKEINEAYEILSDSEKRTQYDTMFRYMTNRNKQQVPPQYKQAKQPPPKSTTKTTGEAASDNRNNKGPATSTPISELFETFRKNLRPNTPGPTPAAQESASAKSTTPKAAPTPSAASPTPEPAPKPKTDGVKSAKTEKTRRGEDVSVEALITPLEAEQGVVKTVNVQHNEICRRCSGTGKVNSANCTSCNGEKVNVRLKKIDVRIPGGVKHGSRVRIAREGGRGLNGGDNGDLFLLIRIAIDPALRIDGLNVYCDLPISPPEAALGSEVEVPTLTGKVKMTIPPLTPSGKVFRLKEQGVQNSGSKGDQFVTIQIVMPESLSAKEKELYQELSKLRPPSGNR